MKKILPILIAIVIISGCTQTEQPIKNNQPNTSLADPIKIEQNTKYRYLDVFFKEPVGWEKIFPYKTTFVDGSIVGPDDVIFSRNNIVIMVTSGGNLNNIENYAKNNGNIAIKDKVIGEINGKLFTVYMEERYESLSMEGFTFDKSGQTYFITLFSNKTIKQEDRNTFNKLLQSIE